MKRLTLPFLLALLLAVGGLPSAQAEDPAPSPYDAARATLPWPPSTKGLSLDGQFLMGEAPLGTAKLLAEPRTDAAGWKTSMDISMGGGAMSMKTTCLLDVKLTPVSGTHAQTSPDGAKQFTWKTTAEGVQVTPSDSPEGSPELVAHVGSFLPSATALLLFCRLTDFRAGTYESSLFDGDDKKFVVANWTCGTKGMWRAQKAHLVTGKRADGRNLEAGFDLATGELLGLKLGDAEKTFEFRPSSAAAPKPSATYFSEDAKTPQQAAAQAGLCFAIADFEMLERILHWPSIHKHMTADNQELAAMDVDGLKLVLMTQFRSTLKPQGQREMLAPILQATAPQLTAEGDDEETVVNFGSAFNDLELIVGKRDGKWLIVRLPN